MFDNDQYSEISNGLTELAKADLSLMQALKIARQSSPDAAKVIARHMYTDTMVPRVGNSFAYKDFLTRNKDHGVHVSLDANSFGAINKEHGFESGNEAIKHLFNTSADISRKYGGKLFRVGGDEGRLHFTTPERANGFVKELREKLAASPNVKTPDGRDTGHRVSTSVGIGYSPEHAEQALIHAKDQLGPLVQGKRIKTNAPGQEQTVHHSLLHEAPPSTWKPSVRKTIIFTA